MSFTTEEATEIRDILRRHCTYRSGISIATLVFAIVLIIAGILMIAFATQTVGQIVAEVLAVAIGAILFGGALYGIVKTSQQRSCELKTARKELNAVAAQQQQAAAAAQQQMQQQQQQWR